VLENYTPRQTMQKALAVYRQIIRLYQAKLKMPEEVGCAEPQLLRRAAS